MNRSPVFDSAVFDTLHASVQGDTDFLADLVRDYLVDAQELLDTMQAAVNTEDASLLARTAHSLKSTSQTVGALALADVCATIEQHAHDGELDTAAHHLPTAAASFKAVQDTLHARKSALEAD